MPNLITSQQWTYLDLFLPILLPTIDTSSIIPGGIPKIEGGITLGRTSSDKNISSFDFIDEYKNSSNQTIKMEKRSILNELETTTISVFQDFFEFTTPKMLEDQNYPRGFIFK